MNISKYLTCIKICWMNFLKNSPWLLVMRSMKFTNAAGTSVSELNVTSRIFTHSYPADGRYAPIFQEDANLHMVEKITSFLDFETFLDAVRSQRQGGGEEGKSRK
ncbi:MAG: hypothetical protein K2X29_07165 [Candidatus Obscuribacterales bacterium]|nr:hypothetical protein [Candidatus Obscuribacterales bacterium]